MAQVIDTSQLINDIGRSFGFFKDLFAPEKKADVVNSSLNELPWHSALARSFTEPSGSLCFKTCGMEDMAKAMRDVSHLTHQVEDTLVIVQYCLLIVTVILCLSIVTITIACLFVTYKRGCKTGRLSVPTNAQRAAQEYSAPSISSNEYAEPDWLRPISAQKKF